MQITPKLTIILRTHIWKINLVWLIRCKAGEIRSCFWMEVNDALCRLGIPRWPLELCAGFTSRCYVQRSMRNPVIYIDQWCKHKIISKCHSLGTYSHKNIQLCLKVSANSSERSQIFVLVSSYLLVFLSFILIKQKKKENHFCIFKKTNYI